MLRINNNNVCREKGKQMNNEIMRNVNRTRHATRDQGWERERGSPRLNPCLRGINNAILIYDMKGIIISIKN